MDDTNQGEGKGSGFTTQKVVSSKDKKKTSKSSKNKSNTKSNGSDPNVLLNLPAGFKYKVPGKQQRIIIGSIVIGLNVLLVLSVALYFYSPGFQDFVYNIGRS